MDKQEYENKDFYERLRILLVEFGEAERRLNSVGNEYMARKFIEETIEELEVYVPLFLDDVELTSIETIHRNLRNVAEIMPLVKSHDANYHFLIRMLATVSKEAEAKLPSNTRLARFFDKLIENQETLCNKCEISEEAFNEVLTKLREKIDQVDDILDPKDKRM